MLNVAEYWYPAIVGVALTGMATALKIVWNRTCATYGGVKVLLYAEIKRYYYQAKEQKWCPLYMLEDVERMHVEYKKLGGNGALDSIMDEMRSMPKIKEEEKNI
jgi:hypothetical protein